MKLFTILILFGLVQVAVSETAKGSCGQNDGDCVWEFDTETKKLSISGNGAMDIFSSSSIVPWYEYKSNVVEVTIEGITTESPINKHSPDLSVGILSISCPIVSGSNLLT